VGACFGTRAADDSTFQPGTACVSSFPEIMPSVFVKTYGCQMNERDSEAVAGVVLLNMCGVCDLAEQKRSTRCHQPVLRRK
jgi:hypothetical protein